MWMRIMRKGVAILTAVIAVLFVAVFVMSKITNDKTIPEIKVGEGILEVKSDATDEELLQGVTAFDKKDGDLTDRLLVESISKFSEIGYCKVTYAVCDSDNHVSTAVRQIHYTDYTSPKFKMNKSLVYSIYDPVNVLGVVGATDCLDGDISQNVIVYSPDYVEGKEGSYTIQAKVMNSKGDSSEIELPMIVEKLPKNSPQIMLKTYLIYVKKGSEIPDWSSYIKDTSDSTGISVPLSMQVKTNFNKDKVGVYTVNYYGTDESGATGHTALAVAVE